MYTNCLLYVENQQILINKGIPYLRHVSVDSHELKKAQSNILLEKTLCLMIKLSLYRKYTYIDILIWK